MKAVLTAANEQLQQALMDKTLESAAALDALRQQQTQQLAAVRRDHQMVVDQMKADAAATAQQHSQVGTRWGNNSLVSTFQTLHDAAAQAALLIIPAMYLRN